MNDHCPVPDLFVKRETSRAFDSHSILLSFDPQEMSLNIDMKMILPVQFSGVSSYLNSKRLTSSLSCNVVYPEIIFHSNSIGSTSILSKFLLFWRRFQPSQSLFPCIVRLEWFSRIFPRHNTESEETCTLVRWRLITLSSPINDRYSHEWFSQPIVSNPEISSRSDTNLLWICRTFVLSVRSVVFYNGLTIVQVILSHEYCWFHCNSHKHSPNHRMFLSIFCNIWNSFRSFSHLIIHPVREWSWFHWHFKFCLIVSNDKLLWPCFSLRINIGSLRSFTRYYLIQKGMRGSIMLSFLVRETWLGFLCRSPRSYIGSHRSFAHLSISFPLLRRPSMVFIPLWVVWWGRTFNKLFMMIVVRCGLSVAADIGSPRSFLFLSIHTPEILVSITSLPRAYWSWGWYIRRHPCNKAHHWSRFCCDSFFSWFLLKSFRHCFRANCRTETDDSNSRKTNQAQLCGSWKHVSFRDSFPWWSSQSLLRCPQTQNKASRCGNWTFEGTQSMWFNTLVIPWDLQSLTMTTGLSGVSGVWIVFPRTETIRSHKSRAGIPTNLKPASKEMISDSVELCETEVCFLHIQLIGTNVWLPTMNNVPPEVDFESSRSPAKSESWNSPSLHCFAVLPT